MKLKITITRSKEWIAKRRLESGENIPENTEVEVEVQALSERSRRVLLECGGGEYRNLTEGLPYGNDYKYGCYARWGYSRLVVDSDSPTLEQIDAAILTADAELATERAKQQERESRVAAEREARAAKNAEDAARREAEIVARKAKMAEARELLADELEKITTLRADRDTLSEFLSHVSDDAKMDALRAMRDEQNTLDDLQDSIENAATYRIFG